MPLLEGEKRTESIRHLIVNGVERYRALKDNTLVYGKGTISFTLTSIQKGYKSNPRGNITYQAKIPSKTVYAFANDGFYHYENKQ
jgi:hypothetical protein